MKKRSRLSQISSIPTVVAANAGVVLVLDQALENIPNAIENPAYLAAGAALVPFNKYIIRPLAQGINSRIKGFKPRIGYNIATVATAAVLAISAYNHMTKEQGANSGQLSCNLDEIRNYRGQEVYEPFSAKARELFRQAAECANVPAAWADLDSLHHILRAESGGRVGIPNYTILQRDTNQPAFNNPEIWPRIHELMREGYDALEEALFDDGSFITSRHGRDNYSSASGLGQLLIRRADEFYPSGRNGIGNPLEEAIGMLRYIRSAHGDPNQAWRDYNRFGEGD